PGTYTIKIDARLSPTGPILASQTYIIEIIYTGTCSDLNKMKIFWFNFAPNKQLRCEIEFWKTLHFPTFKTRANARAKSTYYVYSNGKWKENKAKSLRPIFSSKAFYNNSACIPYTENNGYWIELLGYNENKSSYEKAMRGHMMVRYNTIQANFAIADV